jgi:hypothetical protein
MMSCFEYFLFLWQVQSAVCFVLEYATVCRRLSQRPLHQFRSHPNHRSSHAQLALLLFDASQYLQLLCCCRFLSTIARRLKCEVDPKRCCSALIANHFLAVFARKLWAQWAAAFPTGEVTGEGLLLQRQHADSQRRNWMPCVLS